MGSGLIAGGGLDMNQGRRGYCMHVSRDSSICNIKHKAQPDLEICQSISRSPVVRQAGSSYQKQEVVVLHLASEVQNESSGMHWTNEQIAALLLLQL